MLRILERACLIVGAVLLAVTGVVYAQGQLASRQALGAFDSAAAEVTEVDQSLWSDARKRAYVRSVSLELGAPEALLSIPALDLRVPVFAGTSASILNRGAGRLADSAAPGSTGNIALSSHRDGFFRPLKDIQPGQTMILETLSGRQTFTVSNIRIVDPLDTSVLEPSDDATLTLITCYPFYYVGYAPDRFIVQGVLSNPVATTDDPV